MGMFTGMAYEDKIYLGGGIVSNSLNSRSIYAYSPQKDEYQVIIQSLF